MTPVVKICGLSTPATLDAALDAGADMVGFVFFPKSPRHLDWGTARALGRKARGRAKIVALSVDADDETLKRIVDALDPDLYQLHGRETPARVKRDRRTLRPPDDEGDRRRGARGPRRRRALRGRRRFPADRRQAAEGRGAAGRQRPSLRLEPRARLSSAAVPWLLSGGLDPETVEAAIACERRTRRRRLLGRRERARASRTPARSGRSSPRRGAHSRGRRKESG